MSGSLSSVKSADNNNFSRINSENHLERIALSHPSSQIQQVAIEAFNEISSEKKEREKEIPFPGQKATFIYTRGHWTKCESQKWIKFNCDPRIKNPLFTKFQLFGDVVRQKLVVLNM